MLKDCLEQKFDLNMELELFPSINDRAFWEKAKENSLDFFEKMRQIYGDNKKNCLIASLYSQYHTTGNRSNYEAIYMARRAELLIKVFLECMYNDGRYSEDIIDLSWLILEETTWCLPAHEQNTDVNRYLPDFDKHTIDLFSAETSAIMSFVSKVMGDRLDDFSPVIRKRIKYRVVNEILDNYLERNDYWWMGFTGFGSNNWNPWINSNILISAICLIDDKNKLDLIVRKAIKSVSFYIDLYPQDGACDEGPSYWNVAGLCMIDDIWLISELTNGRINLLNEEKTKNTLEYYMKIYTGNAGVVNFADSRCFSANFYATIYKYGLITCNRKMQAFAKKLYQDNPFMNIDVLGPKGARVAVLKPLRMLNVAEYTGKIKEFSDYEEDMDENSYYLESINVAVMKEKRGLFVAAKGNHNSESHNHNDVGNFIVYKNGEKFLVDIGNQVYSKKTFSDNRYELYSTRSYFHNVPLVNNREQKYGIEYSAINQEFKSEGDVTSFSLDIKNAYENKEQIEKWIRTLTLSRNTKELMITEDFSFCSKLPYELHFVSTVKFEETKNGVIFKKENGETLQLNYDKEKLHISYEELYLDDEYLTKDWGEKLYIISLKSESNADKITYTLK